MSATGLRAFDQTLQQTNTWLKELWTCFKKVESTN
jgi:hypothetical protein